MSALSMIQDYENQRPPKMGKKLALLAFTNLCIHLIQNDGRIDPSIKKELHQYTQKIIFPHVNELFKHLDTKTIWADHISFAKDTSDWIRDRYPFLTREFSLEKRKDAADMGFEILSENDLVTAISCADILFLDRPSDPRGHYLMTKACEWIWRSELALVEFQKLLSTPGSYFSDHKNDNTIHDPEEILGLTLMHAALAMSVIANAPNTMLFNAMERLGHIYRMSGNNTEAILVYCATVILFPQAAYSLMYLADLLMGRGVYEQAILYYRRALDWGQHPPTRVEIHEKLAHACRMTGRYEEAVEHFNASMDTLT